MVGEDLSEYTSNTVPVIHLQVAELLGEKSLIHFATEGVPYYDGLRIALQEGNSELAQQIYKAAAQEFESEFTLIGLYTLSRISDLMGEPERATNYRLVANLIEKAE